MSAIQGGSVTLSCTASAYPSPTIQWAQDTISNLLYSGIVNETIGPFEMRSNLTILDYDESTDQGIYYCIASGDQYYQQVNSTASISTLTSKIEKTQYNHDVYLFL